VYEGQQFPTLINGGTFNGIVSDGVRITAGTFNGTVHKALIDLKSTLSGSGTLGTMVSVGNGATLDLSQGLSLPGDTIQLKGLGGTIIGATSCAPGRFLSSITVLTAAHKESSQSYGMCVDHCPTWQIQDGKTCVSCKNGQEWNGTQCACPDPQHWNGAKCVTCGSKKHWDGSTCVSCPGGQVWNDTACVCPSGKNWNGSKCIACTSKKKWDVNTKKCVKG